MIEGVCRYKSLCEDLQFVVDTSRLAVFTDYFFATFFAHYRLYQLVTSGEPPRNTQSACLHLPLQSVPSSFPPLNQGQDPEIWDYEHKIQTLEQQESIARESRRTDYEAVVEDDKGTLSDAWSHCTERLVSETVSQQVRQH
jgi:hypothetical protein